MEQRVATCLVLGLLLGSCKTVEHAAREPGGPPKLSGVRAWACQLQGLEKDGALEAIVAAPVDLVVIEPTNTVSGREGFKTREFVGRVRAAHGPNGRRKLCLAYLNVGQAESYRAYWRPEWRAPTKEQRGHPGFLVSVDPEDWPDNYPVAFWDVRWRAILFGTPDSLLDRALADDFDGIYLDWILGYEEPSVVETARAKGIDPARAMAELVRDLRAYAQRKNRDFLIVAQNGADLGERVVGYYGWIDGISHESVTFSGRAGSDWNAETAGDIPQSREAATKLIAQLENCRARGLTVLTLDYAAQPQNIATAERASRAAGFVPFVSRTPLDRLPSR